MPAHVPDDDLVAVLQCGDLAVPHARGRAVAMAQQQRRSTTVDLVVDLDAVAVELGHAPSVTARRAVRGAPARDSGRHPRPAAAGPWKAPRRRPGPARDSRRRWRSARRSTAG